MYLTGEEERIYNGEMGWAYEVSMKILVKLGELYGADRLISIESAHVSGVSYKTVGNAVIDFLEEMVKSGGKARVKATTNPAGIDYRNAVFTRLPGGIHEKQGKIIELYRRLGIEDTLTCTPYYLEQPKSGSHLSWAESSAVIYANSIIGSWTNREGGPSALASALIGKTPNYGIHKPENRRPTVLIRVEAELNNESDYGALGILLGKIIGEGIPLIHGLSSFEEACLRQMGAAMATSGMIPMFHLEGGAEGMEAITIEDRNLHEACESLSTAPGEKPDLVFIGCPHCSLNEVKKVAELLRGRRVKENTDLWICMSRFVFERARKYVNIIESAGGKVICDTCAVVTWLKELNIETLMTNSAKTAYYAPSMSRVNVIFSPLIKCVEEACRK